MVKMTKSKKAKRQNELKKLIEEEKISLAPNQNGTTLTEAELVDEMLHDINPITTYKSKSKKAQVIEKIPEPLKEQFEQSLDNGSVVLINNKQVEEASIVIPSVKVEEPVIILEPQPVHSSIHTVEETDRDQELMPPDEELDLSQCQIIKFLNNDIQPIMHSCIKMNLNVLIMQKNK
jgi:hypothetical protein